VTVNYNHSELTIALIESLNRLQDQRFELIIVDNASLEPFIYEGRTPYDLRIIHSKKNLGFAGGNELGMKVAKGEYLYLINNDTEIEQDFVGPIIDCFQNRPNLGMLSTLLRFYDTGLIQYAGASALSKITLRNKSFGNLEKDATPYLGFRLTGNIHGASVVVPKRLYLELGGMWEPFFLYYEEYDWCARFKEAGYDIGFLGDVEVLHKESASVGRMSPLKIEYMFRNRILYARRRKYAFRYLTVFYLISIVLFRDLAGYLFKGQINLITPLFKGAISGLTDSSK
jgi:GT2 family glycosyltransferase